ncbi:hypothetical protein [uncultured Mucilaginibacter sp.]|nr:hypothetical protein [uncultured Mucilaginibacter sp.]
MIIQTSLYICAIKPSWHHTLCPGKYKMNSYQQHHLPLHHHHHVVIS